MKYRRKPKEIEAFQYSGNMENAPFWVIKAFVDEDLGYIEKGVLVLHTDIGDIVVYKEDYLIKGEEYDDEISVMRKWDFDYEYDSIEEEG